MKRRRRQSIMQSVVRFVVLAPMVGLVFVLCLFALFWFDARNAPVPSTARADAAVVFTGGTGRLQVGGDLLGQQRVKRLFISGVDEKIPLVDVMKNVRGLPPEFFCCIDLGPRAVDTISNASETMDWVKRYGFNRIILVTSDYHLRRAQLEMAMAARTAGQPIDIIPYPVRSGDLNIDGAMAGGEAERYQFRIWANEFGKTSVAALRYVQMVVQ